MVKDKGYKSLQINNKWVVMVTDPFIIKNEMNNLYIQNHSTIISASIFNGDVVFRFQKSISKENAVPLLKSFYDIPDDVIFKQRGTWSYPYFTIDDQMLSLYLKLKYELMENTSM